MECFADKMQIPQNPSYWLFAKFSRFKIVVKFNIVQRLETKEYLTFISKAKHKFSS